MKSGGSATPEDSLSLPSLPSLPSSCPTPPLAPPDVAKAAEELFGVRLDVTERFVEALRARGSTLGLIGPRELDRLWERHVLNCALVTDLVEQRATVADIGSGAGFPGVVMALRRPDLRITLIESKSRRAAWLAETVQSLGLANVELRHARAEELEGQVLADVVTARAVAPLERLLGWCWPLSRPGGQVLAFKGERAEEELEASRSWLRRAGAREIAIEDLGPSGAPWSARIISVRKPA